MILKIQALKRLLQTVFALSKALGIDRRYGNSDRTTCYKKGEVHHEAHEDNEALKIKR